MVPYVDMGMVAWLSKLLENAPIRWAHPDKARQQLSYYTQQDIAEWVKNNPNKPKPAFNETGLPGITVFRMACPRDVRQAAQESLGFLDGKDLMGNYYSQQVISVAPEYSVSAWAKDLSDLVNMERKLQFLLPMPNTLDIKIRAKNNEGEKIEREFKLNITGADPMYDWEFEEKTGRILNYGLQMLFRVNAYWLKSEIIPQILQIDVKYKEAISGDPITYSDLEMISFTDSETQRIDPENYEY